jgi:hypothetical protein
MSALLGIQNSTPIEFARDSARYSYSLILLGSTNLGSMVSTLDVHVSTLTFFEFCCYEVKDEYKMMIQ